MDKKNLLILGAGHDQFPMYQAAKKYGVRIIGVDQDNGAYARYLADRFIYISSRDHESLIAALQGEEIHGIISPASDAAHQSISILSRHYNLRYKPSLPAAQASENKRVFLTQAPHAGVRVPRHYAGSDFAEFTYHADKIGYPVVVKPVDSSGSKGISFVRAKGEMRQAFEKARQFSYRKQVVAEEYIEGGHYSAEVFRIDSQTFFAAISKKIHTGPPNFISIGHIIPAPLTEMVERKALRQLDALCDFFEIDNGPVNFDFVISSDTITFIEMGARLAGNGIPRLITECYQIDSYELALRCILNELPSPLIQPVCRQYAALQVVYAKSAGKLTEINGAMEKLKGHPAFKEIVMFKKPGDFVSEFNFSSSKLGYVVSAHPDLAVVENFMKLFENENIFGVSAGDR